MQFPKCTQRRVNNANCTFPPRLSPPHHPATPGWQPPLSLGHAESWPHCGRTATRRAGRVIRPDIQRASDTIFTAFKTSTEEAVKESRSRRRREEEEERLDRGGENLKENRQLMWKVDMMLIQPKSPSDQDPGWDPGEAFMSQWFSHHRRRHFQQCPGSSRGAPVTVLKQKHGPEKRVNPNLINNLYLFSYSYEYFLFWKLSLYFWEESS